MRVNAGILFIFIVVGSFLVLWGFPLERNFVRVQPLTRALKTGMAIPAKNMAFSAERKLPRDALPIELRCHAL